MHVLKCGITLILFMNNVLCSELMLDDEYVIMDGIRVRKDSIRNETDDLDNNNKRNAQRENEELDDTIEDKDDEDEDDEDDDDENIDYDDEEDLESTKHLPTRCHVCRLLAVEVENKLTTVGRIRKTRENRNPIYWKQEVVILRVMENLCDAMTKYNIRAHHPFRYKRGVKSQYRKQIEEMTKKSRIQKWMFATPEVEIDDPTGEIRRLKTQCHEMLVDIQHSLIHWFMKAQSRDLTTWLCAKRVLVDDDKDCLRVEMPKTNRVAALRQKKPKPQNEGDTQGTLHEEL